MYTVKQVAGLTGVAESTLRVWERRYGVVAPDRSGGGYRLYDDDQVAALRDMAALVARGVPASRAAEAVREAGVRPRPAPPHDTDADAPDLLAAARSLDPVLLDRVIGEAFARGPFERVLVEWVGPQLRQLGNAWEAGNLSVAEEHFASGGLMRALATAFDEAAPGSQGAPVVVGLPAGDHHELMTLAFAVSLRRVGVNVVYLGADVPADDWVEAAGRLRARGAVVAATSRGTLPEAQRVVARLGAVVPPLTVWVGGSLRAEVTGAEPLPDDVADAAAQLRLTLAAGGA